ncbi:hypothetical protein LTR53_010339 [Teratosphaeriaceae sp. CCFEE 6253]|nr:hypothetical protein LTR53_010339 [Teratosphaeriaceae sp. CCFEE 6253]
MPFGDSHPPDLNLAGLVPTSTPTRWISGAERLSREACHDTTHVPALLLQYKLDTEHRHNGLVMDALCASRSIDVVTLWVSSARLQIEISGQNLAGEPYYRTVLDIGITFALMRRGPSGPKVKPDRQIPNEEQCKAMLRRQVGAAAGLSRRKFAAITHEVTLLSDIVMSLLGAQCTQA